MKTSGYIQQSFLTWRVYHISSLSLNYPQPQCQQSCMQWRWPEGDFEDDWPRINVADRMETTEQDWRQLNFIYLFKFVRAYFGLLFLFPLEIYHHFSSLFLGQVIPPGLLEFSYCRVYLYLPCLNCLPMQYTIDSNLILHDLIGVMQSKTARSNSFLHQPNNNLYVVIAVEKATGPPVWGAIRNLWKIYFCF